MEHNKVLKGLYPITPSLYKSDIDYLSQVRSVLESGVNVFQFRSKFLSFRRKRFLLKSISNICIDNNVKLIINDDYSLCKLFDISGLHIGRNDKDLISARKYFGKEFIIGKSCYNSIELAKYSMDNNASYVSFGAMYPTKSKASAIIVRHSILIEAKKIIRIPICVIGGINNLNYKKFIKLGAKYIAISSFIWDNPKLKPEMAIKKFK